jgi:prophage antirepressor-like protein
MNELITIHNVRGFIDSEGTAQLNLEDISRGLGFIDSSKGETEYVRWNTVSTYLKSFGFSQEVAKDTFIPENIFYRLAMKAKNETAEKFQSLVADKVLPSIRKTGGYVGNENLFVDTYLPFADDSTKTMFKTLLENIRTNNELVQKQQKELQHKEDVIIGLVDEVELAEKRQILNRVVRHNNANFQERWKELYRQFEMKYHINIKQRMESYNKNHKPKMKSYLGYVDVVMHKVPELYEIACKLYENDIKELTTELYDISKPA